MHTQKFQVFMLLLLVVTVFYKPQSKESEDDGFSAREQRYNTPIEANGTMETHTIDGKEIHKVTIPENITKPHQQQHKFEEKVPSVVETEQKKHHEDPLEEKLEKPVQDEEKIEKKVEDLPQTQQNADNKTINQPEKTIEATVTPSDTEKIEKEPIKTKSDTNEMGNKTDEGFITAKQEKKEPESHEGAENLTNETKVEEKVMKEEQPKPSAQEEISAPAPVETANETNKTTTPDLNIPEDEEEEYEEEEEEEEEQIEKKEEKLPEVPPQTTPVEAANDTAATNESITPDQNLSAEFEEEGEEEEEEESELKEQQQNETALPTTPVESTNKTAVIANETASEQHLSQNESQPVEGEEEEEEYEEEEEEEEQPETPASLNVTEETVNKTTVSNETAPAQNQSQTEEQVPIDGEEEEEYEDEEGEYEEEPLNETVGPTNETNATIEEAPAQNVPKNETNKPEEQKQVAPKPKTSHLYRFYKDDYSVDEGPSNDVFYLLKELNHWHAEDTKNKSTSKKDFGRVGENAVRTWKRQAEENQRKEQHRVLQDTVLIPLHLKKFTSKFQISKRINRTIAKIKALFSRNEKPCTIDPAFIPRAKGMTLLEVEDKVSFGGVAALISLLAALLFASRGKKDPSEQIIITSKDLKTDKDYQDLQKNLTDLRGATSMIRNMVDTKGNGYQPNQRNNLVKKIDSLEQDINTFEKSCVEFATEISAQQKILFKELDSFYES